VSEAAIYLRVSRPTLYRMCAAGILPFHRLPGSGRRRFRREELDRALIASEEAGIERAAHGD
jgi:excisionase family DNA binding protein